MSNLVEEARFLTTLQQRILTNIQEERPPEHGIEREELQRGISILRSDRRSATVAKATATRKSSSASTVDINALISTFEVKG